MPPGVVNVITTSTPGQVVDAMLHDSRVRKLSFTGSTEVGRVLLREAADQVISCSMELGGNAPFIVFDDADLDAAIEGAMIAKMRNGGEACTAANRFYVQRGIFDAFADKLSERMERDDGRRRLAAGDRSAGRWSTQQRVRRSRAWSRTRWRSGAERIDRRQRRRAAGATSIRRPCSPSARR